MQCRNRINGVLNIFFFAVGQDYQEGGQQYNCPQSLILSKTGRFSMEGAKLAGGQPWNLGQHSQKVI